MASTVNRAAKKGKDAAPNGGVAMPEQAVPEGAIALKKVLLRKDIPGRQAGARRANVHRGALSGILKGRDAVGPSCVYTASTGASVTAFSEWWPMSECSYLHFSSFSYSVTNLLPQAK